MHPKIRLDKVCPTCEKAYHTRWDRQVCCSKSCARALHSKAHGNGNWKGGVNKHASGYLKELRKGHPRADKNGYVMQHRLVMEKVLGRYLEANEHIHHMNGIRDDNRPENLELWTSRKDPPGQRTLDLICDMIAKLPPEARVALIERLGA